MAGVLTTSVTIPPVVANWFSKDLLVRTLPKLVHGRVAQRRPLRGKSGNTIIFRRIESLAIATTPILEGIAPAGKQPSNTDVSVTIKQYGDFIAITDLIEAVVEHPVLQEFTKLLAEQAGQTLDALMRDAFVAGTNVFYGGAVASRSLLVGTAQKVDTGILQRVIRGLMRNNAAMFTELIDATDHISTAPVRPAFWAITTPEVLFTLESLSGWTPVAQYSDTGPVMDAEAGAYRNIRFLVSSQAKSIAGGGGTASGDIKSTGGNADVHDILVFGQDAVGTVPLDNLSFENIIHPKGTGGPTDPLNQVATTAWKRTGAELILNDALMSRLEVTVGDVAP